MTTTANTTTQEELEAALAEGAAPISEEGLEIQRRIHEINAKIAPELAEKKACQELLLEEMAVKGVKILTYKGVPVAENIDTMRTKADLPGIIAKYPEVEGIFVTQVPGHRFDAKKVVL